MRQGAQQPGHHVLWPRPNLLLLPVNRRLLLFSHNNPRPRLPHQRLPPPRAPPRLGGLRPVDHPRQRHQLPFAQEEAEVEGEPVGECGGQ